jgi:hypothetical protein
MNSNYWIAMSENSPRLRQGAALNPRALTLLHIGIVVKPAGEQAIESCVKKSTVPADAA